MKTTYTKYLSVGIGCLFIFLNLFKINASPSSVWLECPPAVYLNCDADLSNLDLYGQAWVWENYKKILTIKPKSTVYNTNACGIGTITRTWEYEDKHWNWHRCSQIITITGSNTFSNADINWPPSLEIEGCNPNADPQNLSKPYNYPTFKNKKCAQPMYSYRDMKFTVADGCVKILRDWKVIDWCTYVPNKTPQTGIWTYTQIIKLIVKDSSAYLQCPKDTIVDAKNDCKGLYVKLDSVKGFTKCGAITKIINTSPHSTAKGPDASGYYPIGTTEFYYIAEYGCGKEIKCKVKVTVKNKIPPTPYCLLGVNVALMPVDTNRDGIPDNGMVEIWAKDFDRGSYHICGQKNLNFSFSSNVNERSRVFTCADLGKNEIEMWVTDSSGNQSYCKTMIDIQNNNARIPNCKRKDSLITGTNGTLYLRGNVSRIHGEMIENVEMTLEEQLLKIVKNVSPVITIKYDTIITSSGTIFYRKISDTTYITRYDTVLTSNVSSRNTNSIGHFSFTDLRKGAHYRLVAEKDDNALNGLDINDAIILLRHVIGSERIISAYKLIAADMNCDGTVNYADFDILYGLLTGTVSPSSIKSFWKIIPKTQTIDLSNYLNYPNFTEYQSFDKSIDASDFIAIKLGELDDSPTKFKGQTAVNRSDLDNLLNKVNSDNAFISARAYPNPIFLNETMKLEINLNKSSNAKIELLNLDGKILSSKIFDLNKGRNELEFLETNLQQFVIYKITIDNEIHLGKWIIIEN